MERIEQTDRGLRSGGRVQWIARPPQNDDVTGTIVTVKAVEGYAYISRTDGSANLFINTGQSPP